MIRGIMVSYKYYPIGTHCHMSKQTCTNLIPPRKPRFTPLTIEELGSICSRLPEDIEREYRNTYSPTENINKNDVVSTIGNPAFIGWVNHLSASPEMRLLDKVIVQFDRVKMGLSVDDVEILRSQGYRIEYKFSDKGNTSRDICELTIKDRYYLG